MNIWSEGSESWGYPIILPMLARTFPNTTITTDPSKSPDLVIKSHYITRPERNTYVLNVI